ncbi:uncharacterized protein LOC123831793 [Phyllostomus hastatus]|uniref:uncharacterized protein LOC123831793 n=1 Tax=Phyllostomus hastatus TaxID=9423 RepID=UPI001E6804EA|nr:uncharacterized protein LOC123831793 [Phyllostomus hastatus]
METRRFKAPSKLQQRISVRSPSLPGVPLSKAGSGARGERGPVRQARSRSRCRCRWPGGLAMGSADEKPATCGATEKPPRGQRGASAGPAPPPLCPLRGWRRGAPTDTDVTGPWISAPERLGTQSPRGAASVSPEERAGRPEVTVRALAFHRAGRDSPSADRLAAVLGLAAAAAAAQRFIQKENNEPPSPWSPRSSCLCSFWALASPGGWGPGEGVPLCSGEPHGPKRNAGKSVNCELPTAHADSPPRQPTHCSPLSSYRGRAEAAGLRHSSRGRRGAADFWTLPLLPGLRKEASITPPARGLGGAPPLEIRGHTI